MKETTKYWITAATALGFGFMLMIVGAVLISTASKHTEGEVLGKEPRQHAFLGGTPDFLVINGTGKVQVDAEMYHMYEVGDHFNETVSKASYGTGYDLMNIIDACLPIMVILVAFTFFTGAIMNQRWT